MDNEYLRQCDIESATKALANIGIQMYESDGTYRPFNEVMMDLGKTIKLLRETTELKQFEIMRSCIYRSVVGVRYENQFKF